MSVSKNKPSTQATESTCNTSFDLDLTYDLSIFRENYQESKLDEKFEQKNSKSKANKEICCICAMPQFLETCEKQGCCKYFHSHCVSYYFPELKGKKNCPLHIFKSLADIQKLLHLSSSFNSFPGLCSIVKSEKTGKKQSDLTGNLFWSCISQQYFPYFNIEKPEFHSKPSKNDSENVSETWMSKKIQKVTQKLQSVTQSNSNLIEPIKELRKNCCKRPKTGENIQNSAKMPLNLQGKYIRNYEKIQIGSFKHSLKDYHVHDSEEKIVCAVCEDEESYEDNLIVICAKCNLPVHCRCYNIGELTEHDWLCDPCAADVKEAQCTLCPIPNGALKFAKPSNWVHVTCGRHLLSPSPKDLILDLSKANPEKFKLKCFSCNIKTGACIQCSHGRCATAFHVECRKDLLEISPNSIQWLCPNHKASKLTRQVKQAKDNSDEFISNVANIVWKKTFPEETEIKAEKPKKKVNLELAKKKILMEIDLDQILMKVFVGSKMVKVLRYVGEEKQKKGIKKNVLDIKPQKILNNDIKSLSGLELKVKRKEKDQDITILKTCKGDFSIKMKVPREIVESMPKKRKIV